MFLKMEVSIQVISVCCQKSGSKVVRGSCSITQTSTVDVPFFFLPSVVHLMYQWFLFLTGLVVFPPFCRMGRVPEGRVRRILPSPGPVRLLFLRAVRKSSPVLAPVRCWMDSGRCCQCRSGFKAGCQWRMRRRKQSGRREQGCTISRPLNRDFRCLEVPQINAGGSESHLERIGVGRYPPSVSRNLAWACTGSRRKRPRATRPRQLVKVGRYNAEDSQRHTPRCVVCVCVCVCVRAGQRE